MARDRRAARPSNNEDTDRRAGDRVRRHGERPGCQQPARLLPASAEWDLRAPDGSAERPPTPRARLPAKCRAGAWKDSGSFLVASSPWLVARKSYIEEPLISRFSHRRQLFNLHFGDAVAFHLFYGEAVAFVNKAVADLRNSLQSRQHEAGESFEAIVTWQHQLVLRFKVANAEGAFHHQRQIGFKDSLLRRGDVELVFNFADNLFKNIFHRNH